MYKFDLFGFGRAERHVELEVETKIDAPAPIERSDRLIFAEARTKMQNYFADVGVKASTRSFSERKNLFATDSGRVDVLNRNKQVVHRFQFAGLCVPSDGKIVFKTNLRPEKDRLAFVARHELIHWAARSTEKKITAAQEDVLHSTTGFAVQELQLFPKPKQRGTSIREPLVSYIEGIVDKAAQDADPRSPPYGDEFGVQVIDTILDAVADDEPARKELWRMMLQDYIDGTTEHFKVLIKWYGDARVPRVLARIEQYGKEDRELLIEFLSSDIDATRRADIAAYLLSR